MLILRGMIIGFSIAAPVGPIGVLCIRRSMRDGWFAGFISGLGAATADMLYGCVAAFSLKAISDFMIREQAWLRGIGGLFLVYLGVRTFFKQPTEGMLVERGNGMLGSYSSTFLLTLTNPLTILSFAAIFASIIPSDTQLTTWASVQMVLGVFLGSSAWWIILSVSAGALKDRLSNQLNQWIQWTSGAIIIFFGLAALLSLLG
jgi:threonine/homoserine/homoserine lactone efflux protein